MPKASGGSSTVNSMRQGALAKTLYMITGMTNNGKNPVSKQYINTFPQPAAGGLDALINFGYVRVLKNGNVKVTAAGNKFLKSR